MTLNAQPARLALIALLLGAPAVARAQEGGNPLACPLSIHLTNGSLEQALRLIALNAAVRLSYSSAFLPTSVRMTLSLERTTVGDALRHVLRGTGLTFVVAGSGHIVIVQASIAAGQPAPLADSRSSVPEPQVMERVLVMGTPGGGAQERELTTTVAVLSRQRIARAAPTQMAELFRTGVPGVVAWELGSAGPIPQVGAVRGSSSFNANYLKAYVDGVELASPYLLFALDPAVVERLEVIQGPQGSAMYGSDAISGVAHVITRKGTIGGDWRPRLDLTATGGTVETQYASGHPTTQHHALAVTAGGAAASYRATATLADNGAYVTDGRALTATALAAGRVLFGSAILETTVRSTRLAFSAPVSPPLRRLFGARAVPLIAAAAEGQVTSAQTLGATAVVEPRSDWRHTLIVGYDRNAGALVPQRNPASVADLLLGASEEDARRISARYSTSIRLPSPAAVHSTLTAGVEHSELRRERLGRAAVIGADASQIVSQRGIALYVDSVYNTGAFAQLKVDLHDALYLVAGARGERNSSFGVNYGTAWSPMAGAAYVGKRDALTIKVRAAYGKGIRPPPPSARRAFATPQYRQIANPQLAPESQSGVEGGVDLLLDDRVVISATLFDQRAEGLIQHVVRDLRIAPPSVQLQNVGGISNRGGEAQATIRLGPFTAEGNVSFVNSVVRTLSKSYSGDLRVGDQLPEIPAWTSHVALSGDAGRLSATVGAMLVGDWTGYDWLSYYAAPSGGADAPASLRAYWIPYEKTVRPYLRVRDRISARINWFVRVDNFTNQQGGGRDNLVVLAGRAVSVGVNLTAP